MSGGDIGIGIDPEQLGLVWLHRSGATMLIKLDDFVKSLACDHRSPHFDFLSGPLSLNHPLREIGFDFLRGHQACFCSIPIPIPIPTPTPKVDPSPTNADQKLDATLDSAPWLHCSP